MRLALAVLAALFLSMFALPASAQVLTVRMVLVDCPDIPEAKACPGLAQQFVDARDPGPARDSQIVNLVLAIADAAQQPSVPMLACLNAADGLRVLADGMQDPAQAQQIRDIADSLCEGQQTAAIDTGGGGGAALGLTTPVTGSSGSPSSGDDSGDDTTGDDTGDTGDDSGDDSGDDDDDTGDDDDCPEQSENGQGDENSQGDPGGKACGQQ